MNPDDAFERCLELLYEAALDDARWPAATSLSEEALDASGNALGVTEVGDDDVRVRFARFLRRGDSLPDLMREYFTVYHPLDEASRAEPSRFYCPASGRPSPTPSAFTVRG